jgi:hypothetical protein
MVAARVAHRRRRADAVEDSLHRRADALLDRAAPTPRRGRAGGAGEVEQVGALGVVEPQRVGEPFQDAVGGAGGVAALQALVVLDAHTGQGGDLVAPQPGHAPPAIGRQACLLGRDLGPHITHGETKSAVEQMYQETSIAPEDVAEIIAFAVSRPRAVSLNEILVRPSGQAS